MTKKTKIEVKKIKKRVPVPQKPPKVEEDKKKYKRQSIKNEIQELIKKYKVTE